VCGAWRRLQQVRNPWGGVLAGLPAPRLQTQATVSLTKKLESFPIIANWRDATIYSDGHLPVMAVTPVTLPCAETQMWTSMLSRFPCRMHTSDRVLRRCQHAVNAQPGGARNLLQRSRQLFAAASTDMNAVMRSPSIVLYCDEK
jgi:hypothetical protein